ncbi:DUF3078 domain-containing protein [Mesonia sediminis]|uniref:DUF3078 domain-containing protein n=1 Tax=Mesonia sediminis TaxID=1703946 RepID=A0ABW5SG88_9FLAO
MNLRFDKFKAYLLAWMCIFCANVSFAQASDTLKPFNFRARTVIPSSIDYTPNQVLKRKVPVSYWTKVNKIEYDISEVAFINWNAGGVSSLSSLLNSKFKRIYERGFLRWNNELLVRYGVNQQKDEILKKTDDNIELNSTIGFRADSLSNWFYSAKMRVSTQLTNGYKYPNTDDKISTFFSPANVFLGVGGEINIEEKNFSAYASPLTLRSTMVLDQELANQGAFGVTPAVYDEEGNLLKEGENTKTELGILITAEHDLTLWENIVMHNRLSLYSDYIDKFGNVDVDWEFRLNFKVNSFIRARLGSHLKYDDNIKIQVENEAGELVEGGSRVQWKQQLGIGVTVAF